MSMAEWLWLPFTEFGFMQRALAACLALSLSAPLVGVFLMLRRMSLMGDAMAHGILPGAAIAYLLSGLSLSAMTVGGMAAGMLIAVASGLVARSTSSREDSSLAAFYLISLSLGVLLISTRGSSVDLLHVLFGSVLALNHEAVVLLGVITSLTLLGMGLMYRVLVLECLDPQFLRAVSRLSPVAHYGFLMLLVINLVAGFHALGTLLSVGMMVLPAAAARFWTREITQLILVAMLIAFVGSVGGLLLSYHAELPTGPSMVLTIGAIYLFSLVAGPQGMLRPYLPSPYHYKE
jgi:zinc/manganese transport system permease protein